MITRASWSLATIVVAIAAPTVGLADVPSDAPSSAFSMPWTEKPPVISPAVPELEAVALGRPDAKAKTLSAMRRSARANGERRARGMIHATVDDALAEAQAPPWMATMAHDVVARHSAVASIRPLVDGAALVSVRLPRAALADALPGKEFPWSD